MQPTIEQIEKYIAQFAGENPCGAPAKYEPEFEAIDAEISKLQAIDGASINWGEVSTLAEKILTDKSKDLLIASYLAASRFMTRGYTGLAESLMVIDTLIERYWENLYPEKKRLRGRIAAMEWLAEQLEKAFTAVKPSASDLEAVKSCSALIKSIQMRLSTHLSNQAPDLSRPSSVLQSFLTEQERMQRDRDNKQRIAEQKKISGAAEVTSDSELTKALTQAKSLLIESALFLRKKNITDPASFRLVREAAWIQLFKSPPASDNRTTLPPVARTITDKFVAYIAEGKVKEAVEEIEQVVPRSPFWFDGHKMVCDALQMLGEESAAACNTIVSSLATVIQRFPELENYTFSDGSRFISDETLSWINENYSVDKGTQSQPQTQGEAEWEEKYIEARSLAAKGKFSEGLELLQEGARLAGSGRGQVRWQLKIAQLTADVGHNEAAVTQLEYLDEQFLSQGLDKWDSELDSAISKQLLSAYNRIIEAKPAVVVALSERVLKLYTRLCRSDLNSAIRVSEMNGMKRILNKMFEIERR